MAARTRGSHAGAGRPAMIIYIDFDADPQEIVRILRRELGPELCVRVGLGLAERGRDPYRLLVIDGHEVRKVR
jgi:hypothetical protein